MAVRQCWTLTTFVAARGDCQALAELGFIVVEIEGMGNPLRSKSFHDFYYANMGDNTLPDQITGMKQLAASAKEEEAARDEAWHRYHSYEYALGALEIAIVLAFPLTIWLMTLTIAVMVI